MSTRINAEMLGDIATDEQARRMVALLKERGYDAEFSPSSKGDTSEIPDAVWDECLDIISRESYSSAAKALGSRGGRSTSDAKQAAARANGRKGGRPRRGA